MSLDTRPLRSVPKRTKILPGAQTFRGTLSLTTIAAGRLAGVSEVRVEGDVPCTDNLHEFYRLTLTFDQSYSATRANFAREKQ